MQKVLGAKFTPVRKTLQTRTYLKSIDLVWYAIEKDLVRMLWELVLLSNTDSNTNKFSMLAVT